MPAAFLDQGKTSIRDTMKTLVTHVGLAADSTAFAANQTALNPSAAGTVLIKPATKTDVNGSTFDATVGIDGNTEFTDQYINTIGAMSGSARTNALSRSVRTVGIGVQAGDTYTLGLRLAVEDNS